MHDTGARQLVQRRVAMQQGIDQGARRVARAGMHHQTRRFIQHEDVFIFIKYGQRDVLSHGVGLHFLDRRQHDDLAATHRITRAGSGTIHRHIAGFDPRRQARTGIFRKQLGQHRI